MPPDHKAEIGEDESTSRVRGIREAAFRETVGGQAYKRQSCTA